LIALLASLVAAQGQPTIVSVVPTNGATGVSGDAPVVFTFSTAMDTAATVALFYSESGLVLTSPSWSADGTRMTNTPSSSFPGNSTITWLVMGQSTQGAMLGGTTTGSFTTGSGGPTIVSVTPPSGSTNVSLTAPVVFTFSTNMNKTASLAMFYTSLGASVTVTPSWNTDGTRLTNAPSPAFPANTFIMWLMSGEDTLGRALGGTVNGSFMTGNGGSTTATLVSTVPTNSAANVPTNAAVMFTFSVAMNTNVTAAQFRQVSAPTELLPTTASWSADRTMLTCMPTPGFPPGQMISWSVQGQGATGEAFAGAVGSFTTAGATGGPAVFSALFSRGEVAEQVDTNLWQTAGQEFRALAGKIALFGLAVGTPAQATNTLHATGTDGMEFTELDSEPASFATNYPAGAYVFFVNATGSVSAATISLSDGLLPTLPRLLNWQSPPRAILAQPLSLEWTWDAGGATVSYVRLQIEQEGVVVFDTPLPDSPGALDGTSNGVVVPASAFTNAGLAEVSISAFSFTGLDTNSIPGVTLHAARHRTTTFELRVVDGATPPPLLRFTNLAGVPVGESVMYPLRTTNGARPIEFTQIGGALPPGLALGSDGSLVGQAIAEGTFDARLRLTDLLGQSTTQSLQVVTAPLPPPAAPRLENISRGPGSSVRFEMVGGAGADCLVERSINLLNWTTYVITNAPTNRLTLQVPMDSSAAFFRAQGPGSPRAPRPLTVAPVLNSNVTVSAALDYFGGTLTLTNAAGYVFALTVPPGALDWPEVITITDVAQVGGLPLSGGLRAAVNMQPEGLIFNVPARLDIQSPAVLNTNALLGFSALGDGRLFALHPSSISSRTVSLGLLHFTMAGMGEGTGSDAQAQGENVPDDPMTASDQELEKARQECLLSDCDTASHVEKVRQLMIQYADQTVLPKLRSAVANPEDSVLDDALYVWLEWCRRLELLGLAENTLGTDQSGSDLGKRLTSASGLASNAVANGITKACQDCLAHDVWRTARMLSLARIAELLGWDYTSKAFDCIRKCLVFELKIESEIQDQSDKGTFLAHTKSTVKLRPSGSDAAEQEWAQIVLKRYTGQGQWNITDVQDANTKCPITSAPSSGTASVPVVKIHLYKERTVYVPGKGKVVSYVFDPDLEVYLRASLSTMPDEGRTACCPKDVPKPMTGLFGPSFLVLHADETVSPEAGSLEQDELGGPAIRMTGFQQSGAGDVIFSKAYIKTVAVGDTVATENTLIELHHTPK
jgi:hypothetical protein